MPLVLLVNGPDALAGPHELTAQPEEDRLAVAYYGRHEHYEYVGRSKPMPGKAGLPVFEWRYSTAIAE